MRRADGRYASRMHINAIRMARTSAAAIAACVLFAVQVSLFRSSTETKLGLVLFASAPPRACVWRVSRVLYMYICEASAPVASSAAKLHSPTMEHTENKRRLRRDSLLLGAGADRSEQESAPPHRISVGATVRIVGASQADEPERRRLGRRRRGCRRRLELRGHRRNTEHGLADGLGGGGRRRHPRPRLCAPSVGDLVRVGRPRHAPRPLRGARA